VALEEKAVPVVQTKTSGNVGAKTANGDVTADER
jgi:hypothetical protein